MLLCGAREGRWETGRKVAGRVSLEEVRSEEGVRVPRERRCSWKTDQQDLYTERGLLHELAETSEDM